MRRLIIATTITAVAVAATPSLAVTASAAQVRTTAAVHSVTVLGKKGLFKPGGSGWGTAHPKRIFNGGDPSGLVVTIKWTGWGKKTATGHGLGYAFKPSGGYYAKPVKTILKASHLGHCGSSGPRAYTTLWVKQQKKPGSSHYTKWFRWAGLKNICSRDYT
jgi:hypothetical protein